MAAFALTVPAKSGRVALPPLADDAGTCEKTQRGVDQGLSGSWFFGRRKPSMDTVQLARNCCKLGRAYYAPN